ncbi:hypothetical protein ACWEQ3_50530, partial [Streptomyces mirabilis]
RRRQATHPARTVPELVATAPSQVFTWDITKLTGPEKGVRFHGFRQCWSSLPGRVWRSLAPGQGRSPSTRDM